MLTPCEREVLEHVIAGHLNKQIADALGIVEKTIELHRGRVMEKMGVMSVAEVVQQIGRIPIWDGMDFRPGRRSRALW